MFRNESAYFNVLHKENLKLSKEFLLIKSWATSKRYCRVRNLFSFTRVSAEFLLREENYITYDTATIYFHLISQTRKRVHENGNRVQ
jgi:hypothetical protein